LELVVADAGKMKAVVGAVLALATSLFVVFWGAPDWSLAAGSSMPNPDGIEGWEWRALWFSQSDATTRHIAFAFRQGHGPPVLLLHGTPGAAEQGRLFADEFFPPTRKRLEAPPASTAAAHEEPLLPPYTFIAVGRPAPPPVHSLASEEEEADLYALLLDELDISKVAVLSLPGAHGAAATFARRHSDKCWAVVQVAADVSGFDNCLISPLSTICSLSWIPSFVRSALAHSASFLLPFLANERGAALLPCLSNDRTTRQFQTQMMGTAIACIQSQEQGAHPNRALQGQVPELAVPWLQVVGSDDQLSSPPRKNKETVTLAGLEGGRMVFPRQLGPLISQFLEGATQFLVW